LSGRCKATHSKPLTHEDSILNEPSGINLLEKNTNFIENILQEVRIIYGG